MTPEEARGYIDGLSFGSKQDVWGEFPNRYDHWDAFEAFETIANLRTEYAVQVPVATGTPGKPVWRFFVRRGDNGGAILTAMPGLGKWEVSKLDAEKRADLYQLTEYRIVTRLASTPEVVA